MTTLDLQCADTAEAKFDLIYAAAARPDLLPPVYVLSHNRADNLKTFRRMPWLRDYATVVVVDSQLAAYREAWPTANIIPIPPGYAGLEAGIGRALQFILDVASMMGQDHIITVHDDLGNIGPLYGTGVGNKASRAHATLTRDRRQEFFRGCFTLFAAIAEEAYAAHPDAVIASPQVNNSDRTSKSSEKRWALNQGGNPAQLQSWRVDRYLEQVGGLNLAEFNIHGEDISIACDVAAAGCQVVHIPALITDWSDYETESVIRNPSNAHILRQGEHDALMRKPDMAQYVRTRYDILDRPQWHTMDWAKLKRDGRVKHDVALWTDPVRMPV